MEGKYTYQDFLDIIETLRSENGCPWDKEQTHESLRPCIMEEAYELVAAIRIYNQTKNAENMVEELGDLLLQVVMQSQIAKEEGLFTMEDVINEVAAKMVRRHPHVFGNAQVNGSMQVLEKWEEIKKKEKEGKTWIPSPLREIPMELPALTRSTKVRKKLAKTYDEKRDYGENLARVQEALNKMKSLTPAAYDEDLSMAMADILEAVTDIAYQYKLTPEQILMDRIEDTIDKYEENPLKKA